MKAVEFQSSLNPDQTLGVPPEAAQVIPPGQAVRVLVLLPDGASDNQWEQFAAIDFGQGYAQGDAIYDQLSGG